MIAAVFRHPAKLVLLDTKTGAATQQLDTCGDADDVFFDAKRRRIYVSCGAGAVDAFQADAAGLSRRWRASRHRQARGPHSSCPSSTGCTSPPAPACWGRTPRSSCFDPSHDAAYR